MGNEGRIIAAEDLEAPVTIGVDAYVSPEYVREERDRLWRKTWLQAGRVEDLPEVGNFITYDILDDSVLIVRSDENTIKAYTSHGTTRTATGDLPV